MSKTGQSLYVAANANIQLAVSVPVMTEGDPTGQTMMASLQLHNHAAYGVIVSLVASAEAAPAPLTEEYEPRHARGIEDWLDCSD